MAQLIAPGPSGDTPKVIEDKTRDLAANQGLNEADMWVKIDTEVASARSANKLNEVESYQTNGKNKHGNK